MENMIMKKILIYTMALAVALFATSCSKEELKPTSQIIDSVNEQTDFDKWLEENYRAPFNIRFLYRYEDIQTDMNYNLAPANELYCRILAKMLRYLWIDVYSECAGPDFMRKYSPRMLQIVGSGGWNTNNTINVGLAEGGQKITLNVANWMEKEKWVEIHYLGTDENNDGQEDYWVEILRKDAINGYYLHFTHHEYAHILHQTVNYPTEFREISRDDYAAQWNSVTEAQANQLGFVSSYASGSANEDFVETYSTYIVVSDEEWAAIASRSGGWSSEGWTKIAKKLDIIRNYMRDVWGIDIDYMREVLARRYADISKLDWDNFKTGE